MEAARNRRATFRLTMFAAGVLMTLVMAVATVGRWLAPRAEAPAEGLETVAVSWSPAAPIFAEPALAEPQTCQPSYQLPEDLLEELPPLAAEPVDESFDEVPPPPAEDANPETTNEEDLSTNPVTEPIPSDEARQEEEPAVAPQEDDFGFNDLLPLTPPDTTVAVEPEAATGQGTEAVAGVPTPTVPALAEELPHPPPPAPVVRKRPHEIESYAPAVAGLDERLRTEVREGFDLGRAGALFAARAKFIGVMRKIALAKDAAEGTNRHARALADGLRALDEADDFVPRGDALEAELDTAAIAASHVTPVVRQGDKAVDPHTSVARYSRYAAERLGEAVAGAQAGSMACYGLGKSYARLEAQSDDPHAGRKSGVMHRAALAAHPANYMAANELGVRLASLGHYEQARGVLRQAAAHNAPISKIHANLAAVEQKLGNASGAVSAQGNAERIAQHERATGELSRRTGVQWVAPQAFQRPGQASPPQMADTPSASAAPDADAPVVASTPAPTSQSREGGWKNTFERFKRATGWSAEAPKAGAPVSQPFAPTVGFGPPAVAQSEQRVLR